jgi:adenylate cyclase
MFRSLSVWNRFVILHFLILITSYSILSTPYFVQLNQLLLDRFHGFDNFNSNIVVVAIDDQSISNKGSWPWDRELFAKLQNNLNDAEPKVVGYDILFLEERQGDAAFSEQLKNSKSIVLGSKLTSEGTINPIYENTNIKNGYINITPDADGKTRATNLNYYFGDKCESSFSLVILSEYFDEPLQECDQKVKLNDKSYENNIVLSYSRSQPVTISAEDIINNEFNQSLIKDKIVIVGVTTKDINSNVSDNLTNIFGKSESGVYFHSQVINNLLLSINRKSIDIYYFGAGLILLLLIIQIIRKDWDYKFGKDSLIYLFLIIIINFLGLVLFEFGYDLPFLQSSLIIIISFMSLIFYRYFVSNKDRIFLEKAFGQYINPNLLQVLKSKNKSLKLGGESKTMTVLFSDIRGFTGMSENMNARDLVSFLNQYLTSSSKVVLKNNGTIDKFIGDAIMAFWNAPIEDPKQATHAITAALELTELIRVFNIENENKPNIAIGVGINSGDMVVGNIGGIERFDYTVIGDQVNIAARLESLTKQYGVSILISNATKTMFEKENTNLKVIFRLIDSVLVKGKKQSLHIYQPMRDDASSNYIKSVYDAAFSIYQKGNFKKAIDMFEEISTDPVASMMIKRCKQLAIENPQVWTGIWTWQSK